MKNEKIEKMLELMNEVRTNHLEIRELPIECIVRDPSQPRTDFHKDKLQELAESIRQHGLIQPILVSPLGNGKYQIVQGERRYRACVLAGKTKIPAQIKDISEKEKAWIQLDENLQREDLNPIEEAESYKRLCEKSGYTHDQIANKINRSREYVTNKLRLLDLPKDLQTGVRRRNLSEGHARTLLSLDDPILQRRACDEISHKSLTVRDAELLVKELKGNVSCETLSISPKVEGMLVSIPLDSYKMITSVSKKLKMKPDELIQKAVEFYCNNHKELS